MTQLDAEGIGKIISGLQGKTVDETRASELATEVSVLVDAVEDASRKISFDDEPLQYQAYIKSAGSKGRNG